MAAKLRADAPSGLDLYGYELLPRLYGTFLALCLYRWEIIIRESAIVGLIGVATLGFYIDSALSELKLDRVVALLVMMIVVIRLIDAVSQVLRRRLGQDADRTASKSPPSSCGGTTRRTSRTARTMV